MSVHLTEHEYIEHHLKVRTPKQVSEVLEQVIELIHVTKKALADGKLSGMDYGKIGVELADVLTEVTDYEVIREELKEDGVAERLAQVYGMKLIEALRD